MGTPAPRLMDQFSLRVDDLYVGHLEPEPSATIAAPPIPFGRRITRVEHDRHRGASILWFPDGDPEQLIVRAWDCGTEGQAFLGLVWAITDVGRDDDLARETRRLIAAESLDRDHLDHLDAGNVDPRDQRLHEIIARRRAELDLLRPTGTLAEAAEAFGGLAHDQDGPRGICLGCWRAKEWHRLVQEGLTFTEADARVQAADGTGPA